LESTDKNIIAIMSWQQEMFTREEEYWLVNRLDNDTRGLLYFAKTPSIKQRYKQAQAEGWIQKYYIADVYGKYTLETQKISSPIWHHKFSNDRMVVISDKVPTDKISQKLDKIIKWKLHYVNTYVEKLYYNEELNVTTLLVNISKWIRHQIRSHLSSIWFPIIWEKIYIKKKQVDNLHLFSVGVKRN
jgi:23S rRNA-/tRNA-specific pseudouridylate synthase